MITVVIITKNEEKNIVDVIKNAHKVSNDVIIVDSGSTDKTVELAEANGARVIYRAWDNDYATQRNFALPYVNTEWVLYLDADERINDELAQEIKKEMANPRKVMYRFIRRCSSFGRDFKYGVLGYDSALRMFPKDDAKWEGLVHEKPVSDLPIVTLKGYLKHYSYVSFEHYLSKMNSYSSIGAQNNKLKNKKVGIFKDIVFRPFFAFLKMYILKKGFLEGWLGFVLCLNYSNYTLQKYVKLKLLNDNKE